jgi:phosphatidate phosphatase PAH1
MSCICQQSSSSSPCFNQPELNAGGALDVIVVTHEDGSLTSTDWHVAFERLPRACAVTVTINGTGFAQGGHALRATKPRAPAQFDGDGAPSAAPPNAVLLALATSRLLREGRNEISYTAGEQADAPCVRAFLFLWRAERPAVVFDIDGTVTQSDLAGHLANIMSDYVAGSPTHAGVCEIVCQLHARGYSVVYLTSRPLFGVSGIERTRRFLFQSAIDAPTGYRMPQVSRHGHAPRATRPSPV